jgi:hypothetical protein
LRGALATKDRGIENIAPPFQGSQRGAMLTHALAGLPSFDDLRLVARARDDALVTVARADNDTITSDNDVDTRLTSGRL